MNSLQRGRALQLHTHSACTVVAHSCYVSLPSSLLHFHLQTAILLDLKAWVYESGSDRVPLLNELGAFNQRVAKTVRAPC